MTCLLFRWYIGKLTGKILPNYVYYDKIVFGGVTFDWCVTWKFNKIVYIDVIMTLELFHRIKTLQCEGNLPPKMMKFINYLDIIIDF